MLIASALSIFCQSDDIYVLNIRAATLKTRLLVISKFLTIFFKLPVRLSCFQLCDGLWIVF